ESEILELGDEYEAEEPAYDRAVWSEPRAASPSPAAAPARSALEATPLPRQSVTPAALPKVEKQRKLPTPKKAYEQPVVARLHTPQQQAEPAQAKARSAAQPTAGV